MCLKSFVYVPHFRFASHLLAEQLIGRVSTVKGQIRRAEGSGHTKLTLGDKEPVVAKQRKAADIGLVCRGLQQAGWDHTKLFLCLIFHDDSFCKGHACVAGMQAGLRCATAATCLLCGRMCSFNCVHTQVALAQANIDEEMCKEEDMRLSIRLVD